MYNRNVFTYGTLMIPEVMQAVTGRDFMAIPAILEGYARYQVSGESYPGILPCQDASTEGVLYTGVGEAALARLDRFEGRLYRRVRVKVRTQAQQWLPAAVYAIHPRHTGRLSSKPWHMAHFRQHHLQSFLKTYQGFSRVSTPLP